MKLLAALFLSLILCLPDAALSAPRFSVSYGDDGLTPQQRIRKINREIAREPLTQKPLREAEESQMHGEMGKQKTLTAEEIEQIIDKKNNDLLKQLKPESAKAKANPATPPAENTAFGKVGGIGGVSGGAIGTVGGAVLTPLPKK